jgi:phosphoribosylformylglycinamidine synthase subunit PurS
LKAKVYVTYKPGVLDPQGQTLCQFLQNQGQSKVRDVRIGKLIEFDLESMPAKDAETLLDQIGRDVLANPVIETFRVEIS